MDKPNVVASGIRSTKYARARWCRMWNSLNKNMHEPDNIEGDIRLSQQVHTSQTVSEEASAQITFNQRGHTSQTMAMVPHAQNSHPKREQQIQPYRYGQMNNQTRQVAICEWSVWNVEVMNIHISLENCFLRWIHAETSKSDSTLHIVDLNLADGVELVLLYSRTYNNDGNPSIKLRKDATTTRRTTTNPSMIIHNLLIPSILTEHFGVPHLSPYLDTLGTSYMHGANFAKGGATIRRFNESWFETSVSPFPLDIQALNTMDIAQNDIAAAFRMLPNMEQVRATIPGIINQFAAQVRTKESLARHMDSQVKNCIEVFE
ncbi:hypothetical protein RND71_014467 [Anisodus tanguticus]|uniref:Uncharacterized protein n=1 Tax=Anisodus tanguticus TaxID=243964 RepID=A0AAE1SBU7_9SOLA|nr:hypothetical protein RND71_014467 [Anisodus tanguticus]